MVPSVLERFPQMDRHKSDFPAYLHEYFFGVCERVMTKKQVDAEIKARAKPG